MAVRKGGFDNSHFTPGELDMRTRPLRFTNGEEVGKVVVAETPEGSVTKWPAQGCEEAVALWVMADALAGEFDVVDGELVKLYYRPDETHPNREAMVRAVTPFGCVTTHEHPKDESAEPAARRVYQRALRGEFEANREVESREEAMERYP